MTRGKFITVEGIEGVGKSTNMQFMAERIERAGFAVLQTHEPGGTPLAKRIREILLHRDDEALPDTAELLLFFAARSLNVENAIRPALEQGTWVICDRFTDSTRAYQGAGRGIELSRVDALAEWVHGDLEPDLTVLLDAPPELGKGRVGKRGASDRIEREQLSFYAEVRQQFLALAAAEPERFAVVDASRPLPDVQQDIAAAVDELIVR